MNDDTKVKTKKHCQKPHWRYGDALYRDHFFDVTVEADR